MVFSLIFAYIKILASLPLSSWNLRQYRKTLSRIKALITLTTVTIRSSEGSSIFFDCVIS